MKYWLLALVVILGCAGALTWTVRRQVIPRFLEHANEEQVADWYAGLTEAHAETGEWLDPADVDHFSGKFYVIQGADGRRLVGGYMHARPHNYSGGVAFDIYKQPLRITREGEHLTVASSGPDMAWGTADDVSSDQVKERYQPSTLAMARAAAEAREEKRKNR